MTKEEFEEDLKESAYIEQSMLEDPETVLEHNEDLTYAFVRSIEKIDSKLVQYGHVLDRCEVLELLKRYI